MIRKGKNHNQNLAILRTKPLKKYCQNVWNVTKAVHRGKFIILNTCIKKKAEN